MQKKIFFRFDLIDMFNDTSRYLDDTFTIDNSEFEKHIPDIYPAELQLNKANTSDKETSFLDLNIKVIGSDIHTSVYDKRDDFGFPIVTGHNQYDGKKRDRKNSKDKKEKSDAFSQIQQTCIS